MTGAFYRTIESRLRRGVSPGGATHTENHLAWGCSLGSQRKNHSWYVLATMTPRPFLDRIRCSLFLVKKPASYSPAERADRTYPGTSVGTLLSTALANSARQPTKEAIARSLETCIYLFFEGRSHSCLFSLIRFPPLTLRIRRQSRTSRTYQAIRFGMPSAFRPNRAFTCTPPKNGTIKLPEFLEAISCRECV
jgi:hypothetical protein